ncbi:MAG: acetylornithine deacetylase, partial [Pseudomonadota bacterium]
MPDHYTPREMLEKLVAFPTVSSETNLPLIDFVEDYLNGHGIRCHRVPDETGLKASLFANVGPEVDGGVVLSGHTDVVPVEGQPWTTDPFTLVEQDGKLYGRGTCDMKGFNAIGLALVPEMLRAGLKRPIQIALSYDEEVGCVGAPPMIRKMRETLPAASAVVVGEPSMMRMVNGHKGSIGLETHVRGFEVHSSLVHTGVSAIMVAAKLIDWHSERMAENRAAADPNSPYTPPWTTLHVGIINGGTAGNITARDCHFTTDIRLVPGESADDWLSRYRAFADTLEREMQSIHPDTGIDIRSRHAVPACRTVVDSEAEQLVRRLTGDNSEAVVSYGTEAGQFQDEDYATVICGPGSIEQAHQADEFIAVDQFDAGTRFVQKLITELA